MCIGDLIESFVHGHNIHSIKKKKKYSPDTFPHDVVVISCHSWKIFGGSIYILCSFYLFLDHKVDRISLYEMPGFPCYNIVYRTVHICTRHEKTNMIKKHIYIYLCVCDNVKC